MIFKKNNNKANDGKTLNDFMNKIPEVRGVKKIIAVASAKGGVGKSTIAANLAIFLKDLGKNVALVDADIYGPSIKHLMNLKGQVEQRNNFIIPQISKGIKCMTIGSMVADEKAGVWRGPMVTKILQQLIRAVDWKYDGNEVDIMVVDMPPGTGDVYLSIAERFPISGVVCVSTSHDLAIIDLVKSLDCFKKLNIPIIGLIENMSYMEIDGKKQYIFGKNGVQKFATKNKIDFLGEIPITKDILENEVFNKIADKINDSH
ncbi:MAG: Mrp/NBP35 family ATP-binding protein [Rickettsiales bacterium]|nr:Mrp/NBP35 family ATP-binding protein [Rickettsiales bacterium]